MDKIKITIDFGKHKRTYISSDTEGRILDGRRFTITSIHPDNGEMLEFETEDIAGRKWRDISEEICITQLSKEAQQSRKWVAVAVFVLLASLLATIYWCM